MTLILFLVKTYIVILLFRFVALKQELNFNPIAKVVAYMTDPLFRFMKLQKDKENKFIILFIITLVFISCLLGALFKFGLVATLSSFITFFMFFFMVSVLIGSLVNKSFLGLYATFFFRLGVAWVKLTRVFIPIKSGNIVFAAVPVIFIVFLSLEFLLLVSASLIYGDGLSQPIKLLMYSIKTCVISFSSLFYYASWLLVARALMSWVSPDVRNPVVQLIYGVTEPIIAPFRRIIPTIGMFDFSAVVAIMALWFLSAIIQRLALLL